MDNQRSHLEGLNRNLVFSTCIIAFGSSFLFGWNVGCLNNPVKLVKQFYNDTLPDRYGVITPQVLTLSWSLTSAIFLLGGMLGALLAGYLADILGRKKTLLLALVFSFCGAGISTACLASGLPELLIAGRFLMGLHSGIGNILSPLFLSEIAPYHLRGSFGTVHQLFITIGIFVSSIFGIDFILGSEERWPYLLLLEVVPSLTMLIILPFIPDSPRYLYIKKNQKMAAIKALQFYRRKEDVSDEISEYHEEEASVLKKVSEKVTCLMLFQNDLRKPILIACTLQLIQQFSGINAIFFYSAGIFENARIPLEYIPYAVIGTNLVNAVMTVVSVNLMDKAGRRALLLIPMGFCAIDLLVLSLCFIFKEKLMFLSYLSVVCIIIYVIFFAVGLGPIPMMIAAELFRQESRSKAMAVTSLFNWVFTFVIALGFESLQEALKDYTFLVFLVLIVFFIIFVYYMVPETKGRTIEEIVLALSPSTGRKDGLTDSEQFLPLKDL